MDQKHLYANETLLCSGELLVIRDEYYLTTAFIK